MLTPAQLTAFTGFMRYFFSKAFNRGQTSIIKSGEACRITDLRNDKGQRVFKSEHRATQYRPNEACCAPTS